MIQWCRLFRYFAHNSQVRHSVRKVPSLSVMHLKTNGVNLFCSNFTFVIVGLHTVWQLKPIAGLGVCLSPAVLLLKTCQFWFYFIFCHFSSHSIVFVLSTCCAICHSVFLFLVLFVWRIISATGSSIQAAVQAHRMFSYCQFQSTLWNCALQIVFLSG